MESEMGKVMERARVTVKRWVDLYLERMN